MRCDREALHLHGAGSVSGPQARFLFLSLGRGGEWREWVDGGARRVLALVDPVALAAARWKQKAEMDLDRSRWREGRFAAGGLLHPRGSVGGDRRRSLTD